MRLSGSEVQIIKRAASRHFGPNALVRLFGSRTNDHARGGDIDLLVDTNLPDAAAAVRAEMAFWSELQDCLGEQRIDILVDYPAKQARPPVYRIARETGIRL
jgi:predicted nucleotidyltransferase